MYCTCIKFIYLRGNQTSKKFIDDSKLKNPMLLTDKVVRFRHILLKY